MKKNWKGFLLIVLVIIVSNIYSESFANESTNRVFENWNIFFSEDNEQNNTQSIPSIQEATFYLLRKDISLDNVSKTEFDEDIYVEIGNGNILIGENKVNNEEDIENAIQIAPNISKYIAQNEKVQWYAIQKKDKWCVYGEIIEKLIDETKETVKAKFYILKNHKERPNETENYPISYYSYIGNGDIYGGDIGSISDEEKISNLLAVVPSVSGYINENEKVIWYSIKKESDGWHIDGEVVRRYSRIITVGTMEELKEMDVMSGDRVITTGYYEKEDGNGARYQIQDTIEGEINDGTIVKLENGYYANMIVEDNTISVGQFGGIGDGKFDNSKILQEVFNSPENIKIVFPNGEYKVTDSIQISKASNCEIVGNGSVIFTDDDYNPTSSSTVVLRFENIKNVKIEGIKVEARNVHQIKCKLQFLVNNADGFTMDNCKFIFPESKLDETDETVKFCTGSFKNGWNNIIVKNCEFTNFSDSEVGGLIGFNNYYSKNSSNVLFENNKCYYKGHDEMMAIFSKESTTIENLQFINNEFYALDSDNHPRDFCFSIGYTDGYKVDNILFKGNTFDTSSDTAFMYFGASSNVTLEDNIIKYKQITSSSIPIIFKGDNVELKSNILITNNKITLENDRYSDTKIEGISSGKIKLEKNEIVSKMYMYTMFRENGIVNGNTIILEKGVRGIARMMKEVSDNSITINGEFENLFNYSDNTLTEDIEIKNNTVNCMNMNDKVLQTALLLNGTLLNNYSVEFSNNIFNTVDGIQEDQLYYIKLKDEMAQTIIIKDNKKGAFKKGIIENELTKKFDIQQ